MYKYLFSFVSLAAIAAPGWAQDDGSVVIADSRIDETTITVTATGTRSEVRDTGQPVTVLGEAEIAEVQGPDLTRVLERVPGLALTRNGGVGAFTGVRLRGAEAEQTLVVIDGVRVADPAAPAGGYDFGNLISANLAKIEVLRGSNSTVWGSDAIGGVIAVTTSARDGLDATAEFGARETGLVSASGGRNIGAFYLGATGNWYRSNGFSAAASGTEPDGFEQWALGGQARFYADERFELFVKGRYSEGRLDIDGFPAPAYALADTAEYQKTRQQALAAGVRYDNGPLLLTATGSMADTARDNYDPAFGTAPGFTSKGHSDRVEVRGEYRLIGPLLVNFGGESEWTRYWTLFDPGAHTWIGGAYAQLGIETPRVSAHAGIRRDEHARFGGTTSLGADVSYDLGRDWRLRASVGEGFKAPSLFQLLSDYGNGGLRPEASTSFDLAVAHGERSLGAGGFYAALNLFRRDVSDQIAFVSCFGVSGGICTNRPFGTYDNVGRVRAQGLELELGARIASALAAHAVYALTDTENRTPGDPDRGNALARRPRHALTASLDWDTGLAGLALGGDVRLVGDSFDNAANTVRLDGYAVVTLRAAVPLGDRVELYGRLENLFDAAYQTVAGYGSPPRGAYLGARLKL